MKGFLLQLATSVQVRTSPLNRAVTLFVIVLLLAGLCVVVTHMLLRRHRKRLAQAAGEEPEPLADPWHEAARRLKDDESSGDG